MDKYKKKIISPYKNAVLVTASISNLTPLVVYRYNKTPPKTTLARGSKSENLNIMISAHKTQNLQKW